MSSLGKRDTHKVTTRISCLSSIPVIDGHPARETVKINALTVTESQILMLFSEGYTAKQVAYIMDRKLTYVQDKVLRLRHRFDASTVTHMVAIAFRRGWLS